MRVNRLLALVVLVAMLPVGVAVQSGWVTQNNAQTYITRNSNSQYAVTITQQNTSACTLRLMSAATTVFAVCGTTVTLPTGATLTGLDSLCFSGGQCVVGTTANVTELYNSTTAQAAYVYNTRTSSSVYERLMLGFNSNTAYIRTEALGGGTQRTLRLDGAVTQLLAAGSIIAATSGAPAFNPGGNNTISLGVSGTAWSGLWVGTALLSGTAPTVSSGFGTSPSISGPAASFTVNVGTGGSATGGVLAMPTATNGWNCNVTNQTAVAANRADQRTVQTASTTATVTVQNQTVSTGAALAWTASDVLVVSCIAR